MDVDVNVDDVMRCGHVVRICVIGLFCAASSSHHVVRMSCHHVAFHHVMTCVMITRMEDCMWGTDGSQHLMKRHDVACRVCVMCRILDHHMFPLCHMSCVMSHGCLVCAA